VQLLVAIHETIHALGFSDSLFSYFKDAFGESLLSAGSSCDGRYTFCMVLYVFLPIVNGFHPMETHLFWVHEKQHNNTCI
jgi:hypothetical protein